MSVDIFSSLSEVKGVGQVLQRELSKLGLKTVKDLLYFYPRRYEDYSSVVAISELRPGAVTVEAELSSIKGRYVRRGMHITEALVADDSGELKITWFNQPYRSQGMKIGSVYYFSGQFQLSYQRFQLINPSTELAADFTVNTARIVPVYKQRKGITSKQIRKVVAACLDLAEQLPETLPAEISGRHELMDHSSAVKTMHYPDTTKELETARRRLGYEEIFELALASLLNKEAMAAEHSFAVEFDENLARRFVSSLPFKLTDDQRRTVWRIYLDMSKTHPMNRLVEGDVGSGKTVVAIMGALMAMRQGYQVALMAPTELLASQHADTFMKLLKPLGLDKELRLLTGGLTAEEKKTVHNDLATGSVKCVIGTHALIQEAVAMPKLALVIVDEQHRFGVAQRKALMSKAKTMPHVLSLTATPIPRSLALTLYGELSISKLKQKPSGRLAVRTKVHPFGARDELYRKLSEELRGSKKTQMYVVCPLIAESEDSESVQSAEKVYAELSKKYFKDLKVGLLHGKMKPDAKQDIMGRFATGELKVLVSTTVIEVGVDVADATLMVIESADRFGLAQLHQLRGRVGRSDLQSYCHLMLSAEVEPTKRLRAIESSTDGFRLAEYDLELRGAGAIYGSTQHGALDLRIARFEDRELIQAAREGALMFLAGRHDLVQYPQLANRITELRKVTNLN